MNPSNTSGIKDQIKKYAYTQGFSGAGFTTCGPLLATEERFSKWLSDGYSGPLDYLTPERVSGIRDLFPEGQTALVVFFPYARPEATPGDADGNLKLSRYFWGADYHGIINSRLSRVLEFIRTIFPAAKGRVCVDTSPIFERCLAVRAGLGWQGKNTLLIAGMKGSWGFLGVLLLDIKLDPDPPFEGDRCGTCTRCLEACPTNALEPFRLDCRRCIATWNIERESPPPAVANAISKTGWVAGCDICQEVCPWNRRPAWGDPELWGGPDTLHAKPASELCFTPGKWKKIVAGTALRRIRHRHWAANVGLAMAKKN